MCEENSEDVHGLAPNSEETSLEGGEEGNGNEG